MKVNAGHSVEKRFEQIVRDYGRFLRQTIIRVCPKDVGLQYDEIEQEARLRLWRALESEREIQELSSYLYRIAVTTTLDAIKRVKRKREEQMSLAEDGNEDDKEGNSASHVLLADPKQAPDQALARQQLVNKVKEAMKQLPDNRRTAVGLHLEGLTTQEIADLLGWSEPKARNLVYRGLGDVRAYLQEAGVEYAT
jgi:RNA polymerase sigma-70 factor (ECF subfamily)